MFCLQIFYKPDNINGKIHGKRFQFGLCHKTSPFTGSIAQKVIVLHARPPSSHEVRITHKKTSPLDWRYAPDSLCCGKATAVAACHRQAAKSRLSNPSSEYPYHKKDQSVGLVFFVVGEDGFEPSKRNAADLQSVPFGHSGTPPYSIGSIASLYPVFGAGRRTRTPDLLITNQLLYQLSYTGVSNRTRIL